MIDWSLRDDMREAKERALREADDHFYGPWKGGAAKGGGRPMTPAEQGAADMVLVDKHANAWMHDQQNGTVGVDEAISALREGKVANVAPESVGPILDKCAAADEHLDLTELSVNGTLNFGGDGLGMDRLSMPQVPKERMPEFLAQAAKDGISVKSEMVKPGKLRPIQKEISTAKVGGMLAKAREKSQKKVKPILVSKDNFVLDGHHHWGAMTALGFERKGVRTPVTRLGVNHREALAYVKGWTDKNGISAKALNESEFLDGISAPDFEEADGDHFYGPWKGGAKGAGGRPAVAGGSAGKAANPGKPRDRWGDHDTLISEMESKYPGASFSDAKKMPIQIASDSVDTIDILNDRFGTPPNFQGIRVGDGPPGVLAEVKRVNPAEKGSAVYLYGPFKSQSSMDAQAASAAGTKHFVSGGAGTREFTRGVVTHEMGHQYLGMNLHSRLGANRDAAVRKELEPFLHNTFFPAAGKAHVSKYARKNKHEAWAELFTAAVTGWPTQSGSKDPTDYPKATRAILDKHYPVSYAEAFLEAAPMNLDAAMAFKGVVKEYGHICGFMYQHPELWEHTEDVDVREDDDHFYGPWKGGARKEGGHPAGEDTLGKYVDDKGKWDPDRVASVHEGYYESVLEGVPTSSTPTVYMTGGGPASGKTQGLLQNPDAGIPDAKHAAHVDPDGAKLAIPEYQDGIKSGYVGAAAYAHEESSMMAKQGVARALGTSHDVVYDSVGDSGIDKLSAKVQTMRDQGAQRISANYAVVNVNEAIRRSDARAATTGRFVPHAFIRQAHSDVRGTLTGAIERGIFDDLKVFDTNGDKPRLIATYSKKSGLSVSDKAAWDSYTSGGYE